MVHGVVPTPMDPVPVPILVMVRVNESAVAWVAVAWSPATARTAATAMAAKRDRSEPDVLAFIYAVTCPASSAVIKPIRPARWRASGPMPSSDADSMLRSQSRPMK